MTSLSEELTRSQAQGDRRFSVLPLRAYPPSVPLEWAQLRPIANSDSYCAVLVVFLGSNGHGGLLGSTGTN
jgi:hypothetical protein